MTRELRSAGWGVERRPFDLRLQWGVTDRQGRSALPTRVRLFPRLTGANLVAELPGSGPGPVVVVGAHLDTVQGSPGADDNASGVAAVLELARLLGQLPRRPAVVLLLSDMEELGFVGARAAARDLARGRHVKGMLCLESVGFYSDEPGSQRLPGGFPLLFPEAVRQVRARDGRGDCAFVVHRRSSQAAADFWVRAAEQAGPRLNGIALRDPRPDGFLGSLAGLVVPPLNNLGRSDHAAFWNRGIPALMVTDSADFRNRHYHRPEDTPATLDYDRLAAVVAATAATAVFWSPSRAS
ncbi:M28 family peptidase [Streptomyces shenzhenensis]|uniref:M28 family peptidase n=1 Tax=Streptomyces shenzhenensis TaxID=943815 RepID=UPI003D8B7064